LLWTLQRRLRPDPSPDSWDTSADGQPVDAQPRSLQQWPILGLFAPQGGLSILLSSLRSYLSAGSYLLLRSIAKISTYSICAREAAKLGAASIAAHNMCFQLGVATTQLCESIAIATQALLAMEMGSSKPKTDGEGEDSLPPAEGLSMRGMAARHILSRALWSGGVIAGGLSLVTMLNRKGVVNGLTTIPEVRIAAYGVMPLVLLCQTLKGLAYPVNGALMGALDWRASAIAMWAAQGCSVLVMAAWSQGFARPLSLNKLWAALATLFATQVATGLIRIASRRGPWRLLDDTASARK
jgi:Na+-driven multidrug efflux pump